MGAPKTIEVYVNGSCATMGENHVTATCSTNIQLPHEDQFVYLLFSGEDCRGSPTSIVTLLDSNSSSCSELELDSRCVPSQFRSGLYQLSKCGKSISKSVFGPTVTILASSSIISPHFTLLVLLALLSMAFI